MVLVTDNTRGPHVLHNNRWYMLTKLRVNFNPVFIRKHVVDAMETVLVYQNDSINDIFVMCV